MRACEFCFIMPYHISENRGGGAEVQAWLLAKELVQRGYRVAYIAKSVTSKAGQTTTLDGVMVRWVKNTMRFPWLAASDYYHALLELSPSIVVQRMTSFETGVAAYYCRKKKVPFIWICTDNSAPFKWLFLKSQWRISKKAGQRWIKRLVFLASAVVTDFSRHYGMAHTSLAFTQNDFQKAALVQSYGLKSSRMPSGHHLPVSLRAAEARLRERTILWVANLGPRKRPELFVDLARQNRGNREWRFVMIGSRADKAYVQVLFNDKPDNLEWLGRLHFDEALSWFDRAAWFVNTSVEEGEGFPNTFIQAWLRGVPVLTLGCDPDGVITRNDLGFVCDTIEEMDEVINRDWRPEVYEKLSGRVEEYAKQHHSIQVMTDYFLMQIEQHGWIVKRLSK